MIEFRNKELFHRSVKLQKFWSVSSDSQELENPSQSSNFSDCSDLVIKKELLKIKLESRTEKLVAIKNCLEDLSINVPEVPSIVKKVVCIM